VAGIVAHLTPPVARRLQLNRPRATLFTAPLRGMTVLDEVAESTRKFTSVFLDPAWLVAFLAGSFMPQKFLYRCWYDAVPGWSVVFRSQSYSATSQGSIDSTIVC
jgi:hypothetical protein